MRILVIEDEPRILRFLARGLETEGFAVRGARDGREGLQLALAEAYDLVLLDLLLPEVDGLTLLRELAQRRSDLPVVIVSARSDVQTKLKGFGLGACDYLTKPFSFDELLARIRVHLRKSAQNGEDGLVHAGRITLDLARRQAAVDGRMAHLSEREFRLLHQLAGAPGEVFSRERLLSEVWGYHFDPGSNVVDVCVRRLRAKLGPDAPIETVRHAGYRLAEA